MASLPALDSPQAAGIITVGALVLLVLMRKGFHGAKITVGA